MAGLASGKHDFTSLQREKDKNKLLWDIVMNAMGNITNVQRVVMK